MSRLLSEKRLIAVDTTADAASNYDAGACVIDTGQKEIKVSNGTTWSTVQISTDVTFETLSAALDIDADLSDGATADTIPSSTAVKTYVDDEISGISIPTVPVMAAAVGSTTPNQLIAPRGATLHASINADSGITLDSIGETSVTLYNYNRTDFTITFLDTSTNPVPAVDFADDPRGTTTVTSKVLSSGQKMLFITDPDGNHFLFTMAI